MFSLHCIVEGKLQSTVYQPFLGSPHVTNLGYDNQSRTFTCTSTGGPATIVTWRKDGAVITLNATHQQTKRVVDPVESTYQTVLTIDSSVGQSDIVGTYCCTVENVRGRSSMMAVVGELTQKKYVYILLLPSLYSHLTTTLHELDFLAQLMRPYMGWNPFYILGDLPNPAVQSIDCS